MHDSGSPSKKWFRRKSGPFSGPRDDNAYNFRGNLLDGLPCIPTLQTSENYQDGSIFDGIRLTIPYEYRLHGVVVDAVTMIVRTVDLSDIKDIGVLRSLVELFDTQARKVRKPDDGDRSKLMLMMNEMLPEHACAFAAIELRANHLQATSY